MTIVAEPQHIMTIASLDNDDMGEDDIESNILSVTKYTDVATGEEGQGDFILPADAYRDTTALEWIIAIKTDEDSTCNEFNDFVAKQHQKRADLPKLNAAQIMLLDAAYDGRAGTQYGIDRQIDRDDPSVDQQLALMREFYGEE